MRNLLIIIVSSIGLFMHLMVWATPVATTGTTTGACSGGCGATPPVLASVEGGTPAAAGALCPASSPSGCNVSKNTAVNHVDHGFIRNNEALGGSISTVAIVPQDDAGNVIGHSGVTIGAGIDLGGMTAKQLTDYGMPASFVTLVTPYLGLQGKPALTYLDAHPLTIPANQIANLDTLQVAVENAFIQQVATNYNNDSTTAITFFQLPAGAQTAIVDVAYQYGAALYNAAPTFWGEVTQGKWNAAVGELNNFGDAYQPRRTQDANLIQADISSGKLLLDQTKCP